MTDEIKWASDTMHQCLGIETRSSIRCYRYFDLECQAILNMPFHSHGANVPIACAALGWQHHVVSTGDGAPGYVLCPKHVEST